MTDTCTKPLTDTPEVSVPDLRGCTIGEVLTDEHGTRHTVTMLLPGAVACDTGLHAWADTGSVIGIGFGRWVRRKGQRVPVLYQEK